MKERQEAVRKRIEMQGEITLAELVTAFPEWSEMTLRRDLEQLEKSRVLIRTKGGARLLPTTYGLTEDVYGEREKRNYAGKQEIGRKAVALAERDSAIFLDAGSTAMALARNLPDTHFAVIASAPNIALEILMKKQHPSVILLGGVLSRKTVSVSGLNVLDQIRNLNIDTAFMCASGYTEQAGFSVGSQHDCELKRLIARRARRLVMLMDSTKIGTVLPFTFAGPEDIDILVTDGEAPKDVIMQFKRLKKKIL